MQIKDNYIHFDLNGGAGASQESGTSTLRCREQTVLRYRYPGTSRRDNPHGSYLDMYFDKYVPEMSAAQLRALLYPVLDFNARNKEEAYLDTVPPKVKEAIKAHHVLVGMNTEMVVHAKGKAPKKVREKDGDIEYEEWIYGEAPQRRRLRAHRGR